MQFILAMVGDESGWESPPEEMEAIVEEMGRFNRSLVEAGVLVDGGGLHPPSTATTVRFGAADGPVATDGPFAETKEHLAGYWVIEVDALEDALEWTRQVPIEQGTIEVRQMYGLGEPISMETFERLNAASREAVMEAAEQNAG
jgi:hypothetical protein